VGTAGGFSSIFEVYSAVRLTILNREGHGRSTQDQATINSGQKKRWLCVNTSVHANGHAYVTGRSNSVAFDETCVAKAVRFCRLCFEHAEPLGTVRPVY